MAFHFEPHQMRRAARAIAEAFPIQSPKTPLGLENLFRALAALSVEDIPRFGTNLGKGEWTLLCEKYRQTSDSRVLFALGAVLAHRGDRRCTDILSQGFHQLPTREEIRILEEARTRYDLSGPLNDEASWVCAYVNRTGSDGLVGFLRRGMAAGMFSFRDLAGDREGETPLLERLMESIFSTGGEALRRVPAERASAWAVRYLEGGWDDRVIRYLNEYPESGWNPDFLERLYRAKGPPDPAAQPFYRELEKGRVWAIRKKYFPGRLAPAALSPLRVELWFRWLHRCRDCGWEDPDLHLYFEDLHVVEQPQATRIFRAGNLLETIPFDHEWSTRLEARLGELLPWGYRV